MLDRKSVRAIEKYERRLDRPTASTGAIFAIGLRHINDRISVKRQRGGGLRIH